MKRIYLILLISVLSMYATFGQNYADKEQSKTEGIQYRHSIGASLWMIANFTNDSPDYYLLTYGYRLSKDNRVFVEYNTWRYEEPLGTYGDSDEFYPNPMP